MQIINPCKKCIVRAGCSIPYNCHLQDNYRTFINWVRGLALGFMAGTIICHTLIIATIVPEKDILMVTIPLTVLSAFTFAYSIIIESKADDFISKLGRRN